MNDELGFAALQCPFTKHINIGTVLNTGWLIIKKFARFILESAGFQRNN